MNKKRIIISLWLLAYLIIIPISAYLTEKNANYYQPIALTGSYLFGTIFRWWLISLPFLIILILLTKRFTATGEISKIKFHKFNRTMKIGFIVSLIGIIIFLSQLIIGFPNEIAILLLVSFFFSFLLIFIGIIIFLWGSKNR